MEAKSTKVGPPAPERANPAIKPERRVVDAVPVEEEFVHLELTTVSAMRSLRRGRCRL